MPIILLYYVHKLDAQRRDSTFAPSPQTYATAAFGRGVGVRGGKPPVASMPRDSSEQSQRASCEPLTAVAEREDIILRQEGKYSLESRPTDPRESEIRAPLQPLLYLMPIPPNTLFYNKNLSQPFCR